MSEFKRTLFLFHRDLRIQDNTGLIEALRQSESVIPCFIFDPIQASDKNEYKGNNALQFMIHSLKELGKDIVEHKGRLYLFYGETQKTLKSLIKNHNIEAIFSNADYTPFSIKRDRNLQKMSQELDVQFVQYHDALLHSPGEVVKSNDDPYTVFTPYYKRALTSDVALVSRAHRYSFANIKEVQDHEQIFKKVLPKSNPDILLTGGRAEGLRLLKRAVKNKVYAKVRDFPSEEGTSFLSAHHKFGTISIRESYHALTKEQGASSPLVRQLYWRDFFTQISYHFPHVFGHAFNKKYDGIAWSRSRKDFDLWCEGVTGFPIVDAGMRQLNTTGYMHNRLRMIVASFLTKDLHINWRHGERYFATQLIDYDPCVNNGSWQWAASTGCDAQPYFRIFNPWLQQKKFDAQAAYIKRWIPELKNVPTEDIHRWDVMHDQYEGSYPAPIVDHKTASAQAKEMFKQKA